MFRKKYSIDGSRLSINLHRIDFNLESEVIFWLMEDDPMNIHLTTGGYIDIPNNIIFVNPYYISALKKLKMSENNILKEICNIISHEFLHMWLRLEMGVVYSDGLDKICRYMDDIHTECGGL